MTAREEFAVLLMARWQSDKSRFLAPLGMTNLSTTSLDAIAARCKSLPDDSLRRCWRQQSLDRQREREEPGHAEQVKSPDEDEVSSVASGHLSGEEARWAHRMDDRHDDGGEREQQHEELSEAPVRED